MENKEDSALSSTLDLLLRRLKKLESLALGWDGNKIAPKSDHDQQDGRPLYARLRHLEDSFRDLASKHEFYHSLLHLFNNYPSIFPSATFLDADNHLSSEERLSILNSCAQMYATTASRLVSIQDAPLPTTDASMALISLLPRLVRAALLQEEQALGISNLTLQSASTLHRWYEIRTLGAGECWVEWEDRIVDMEKLTGRKEKFRV